MTPLVYVIVLNWNGKEHLPVCLGSLRRLSYPNARTLLVDNGSTDGSREYARTAFPEVEILPIEKNIGFAAANNRGMRLALERGADYVALLNNDMEVDPGWLSALTAAAESDPAIGVCATKLLYFGRRDLIQGIGVRLNRDGVGWDYLHGRYDLPGIGVDPEVAAACGGAFFARAKALREAGLFDPAYFIYMEDAELSLRIWDRGYRVVTVPAARAYHKLAATMVENSPWKNRLLLRNRILFILKCFPARMVPAALAGALRRECGLARAYYWSGNGRMIAHQARALLAVIPHLPRLAAARKRIGPVKSPRVWELVKDAPPPKIRLPQPPAPGWEKGGSASIRPAAPGALPGPGWYRLYDAGDGEYRWFAREASLSLTAPAGRCVLTVEAGNDHACLRRIPLRAFAEGKELGRVVPGAGWCAYTFPLRTEGPGPVAVTLRADDLYRAEETGEPTDLSFKVRAVTLEPSAE